MGLDIDRMESIRPDAHQFVVGILWLIALSALIVDSKTLLSAAGFIDSLSLQMTHARIPDFVTGFLIVIVGVILPYCVAEAFIPLTTVLMNVSLRIYRRRNKHLLSSRLTRPAGDAIRADVKEQFSLTWQDRMLYLTVRLPSVAEHIRRARTRIEFRAVSVVPVAFLFGAIAGRFSAQYFIDPVAVALGAAVAFIVFVVGSWMANRQFDSVMPNIDLAALMLANKEIRSDLYARKTGST